MHKEKSMEHSVFVEKFNAKQIAVSINKNEAGFMYGQQGVMPQNLRTKQAMLRAISFGGILGGLILFFFAPWWVAVGVLAIGFLMAPYAQNRAANGILQACLQSPQIYELAVHKQVLKINKIV